MSLKTVGFRAYKEHIDNPIVVGCNYHVSWQRDGRMRFVLEEVKGNRARLKTRVTKKDFWTDTKDRIFIKTKHNIRKALRLQPNPEIVEISDQVKQIMRGKICPYCKQPSQYVDSSTVYGRSYGMIYMCKPCDAWVGVHKGTDMALGRLANKELRQQKITAHNEFDALWKGRLMKRSEVYAELSKHLHIPIEYTHIGMFSIETCKKVTKWAKDKFKELNTNSDGNT